jgi:hypothetical protein
VPEGAPSRLAESLVAWERSRGAPARWRAWLAPQSMITSFASWRSRQSWLERLSGLPVLAHLPRLLRVRRPASGEQL